MTLDLTVKALLFLIREKDLKGINGLLTVNKSKGIMRNNDALFLWVE
jgi:hypothetical protein